MCADAVLKSVALVGAMVFPVACDPAQKASLGSASGVSAVSVTRVGPWTYTLDVLEATLTSYRAAGSYTGPHIQGKWSYSGSGGYEGGSYRATGTYRGSGRTTYPGYVGDWDYEGTGDVVMGVYRARGRFKTSGTTAAGNWMYEGHGVCSYSYAGATCESSGAFIGANGARREWRQAGPIDLSISMAQGLDPTVVVHGALANTMSSGAFQ